MSPLMLKMPRLLVVTDRVPSPQGDEPSQRAWQMVESLSSSHQLTLVALSRGRMNVVQWRLLTDMVQHLALVPARLGDPVDPLREAVAEHASEPFAGAISNCAAVWPAIARLTETPRLVDLGLPPAYSRTLWPWRRVCSIGTVAAACDGMILGPASMDLEPGGRAAVVTSDPASWVAAVRGLLAAHHEMSEGPTAADSALIRRAA